MALHPRGSATSVGRRRFGPFGRLHRAPACLDARCAAERTDPLGVVTSHRAGQLGVAATQLAQRTPDHPLDTGRGCRSLRRLHGLAPA
jgi:hypothetical protein